MMIEAKQRGAMKLVKFDGTQKIIIVITKHRNTLDDVSKLIT